MKLLLALTFLISNAFASIETLNYKILPGQLHTGGTLNAKTTSVNESKGTIEVLMSYDVIKKPLVPAPSSVLKNSMSLELPIEFQDERGYLELEVTKSRDMDKVIITHLGRANVNGLIDAHRVLIKGKNGKFECEAYYHPAIAELGWPVLKLTLHVALLNNYEISAELK